MKEFQGLERGLRGRTPETIVFEVAGHVVLYLLVRWLMVDVAGWTRCGGASEGPWRS